MRDFWVGIFGAPNAVLADKGTAFISKSFQSYICDELAAELVFSGTGYPQGNAINEAVHKGIEASIMSRIQYDTYSPFQEILSDAVLAYNSTPHSGTGYSPFYMLFGKELTLPGLQRFQEAIPEAQRRARTRDIRVQAMHRSTMGADEGLRLYSPPDFNIGDKVVYYLTASERKGVKEEEDLVLTKYNSNWSTPVTVTKVNSGNVELLTTLGKTVVVPVRLVRKLGTNTPPSLQPLVMSTIQRERGRIRVRPEWADKKRARETEEKQPES